MLKEIIYRISFILIVLLIKSCSSIKMVEPIEKPHSSLKQIDSVYFYTANEILLKEAKKLGPFEYKERENWSWQNMKKELIDFAISNGANIICVHEFERDKAFDAPFYISGILYYLNSEKLKIHYADINSLPKNKARIIIIRDDEIVPGAFDISIKIDQTNYGKMGRKSFIEHLSERKNSNNIYINDYPPVRIQPDSLKATYFRVKKQVTGSTYGTGIQVSFGPVVIDSLDYIEGKLLYQEIKNNK